MTAKEKQTTFIRTSWKPLLKKHGYLNSSQTWWKDKGDFINIVNLQNFSWNSKGSVDFCFNIGIALKKLLPDEKKSKPRYSDTIISIREGNFLPDASNRRFGNATGYSITDATPLEEFISGVETDFMNYILPKIEEPKSLDDCVRIYGELPFWGERLKDVVRGWK